MRQCQGYDPRQRCEAPARVIVRVQESRVDWCIACLSLAVGGTLTAHQFTVTPIHRVTVQE